VRAESIIHASLLATVTDAPPYGMVASHHRRAVSTPDELFRERERLDQRAIIRRPVSFSSCMCGPAPATVNPAAHACAREFLLRFRFSATLACRGSRGSRALPGAQRSRCQMGRVVTATGRVCLVTSSPTSTGLLGQSFRMRLSNQTS
jgi:hypothetical protein